MKPNLFTILVPFVFLLLLFVDLKNRLDRVKSAANRTADLLQIQANLLTSQAELLSQSTEIQSFDSRNQLVITDLIGVQSENLTAQAREIDELKQLEDLTVRYGDPIDLLSYEGQHILIKSPPNLKEPASP